MTKQGNANNTSAISILALALAMGAAGCGGGGSSPGASSSNEDYSASQGGEAPAVVGAVHETGSDSVEATFGAAGGSLTLASGPKVEIPAGSFSEPTDIVLKEAPMTTAFFNEEAEKPVGPTFVISPGIEPPEGSSVRVSIPLASYPAGWGDIAIAYEYPVGNMVGAEDSQHTRWQYENARLSGGRAVADLPALNGYRLQFVLSNLEAQ